MKKTKKILCLILARGGSKRVPQKNILPLAGKPLIAYTIECAKRSKYINRIIVSTDDKKIAKVAKEYGAETPFLRPLKISQDNSIELDAFKHALSWLKDHEQYEPDLIVKLFPTSPFRKTESVDNAVKLLINNLHADSVRSVTLCSEHPYKMWKIKNNYLQSLIPMKQKPKEAHTFSYQKLPIVYIQNASIDVTKPKNIWKKESITGEKILPYVMDEYESLDINTKIDFELAELVMEHEATQHLKVPLIDEDLKLFTKYLNYHVDNCIICGGTSTSIWAKYESFTAVQCNKCKMIWINPMVNKEGTAKYYNDYIGMRFEDKDKTEKRKKQYVLDREYIQQYITTGKVLDVGCSGGFFLQELGDAFDRYGIEIDGKAVEYARINYSFGNNVVEMDLIEAPFEDDFFDLIIMRGVIEHLHDPNAAVKKVSHLLKKGGFFYISATPNAESFSAEFYRERWNLFHPIRHLYYFNILTLSMLCKKYNLKMLSYQFPYLKTPYASVENDIIQVYKDIKLRKIGKDKKTQRSPPFWENIMNIILIKK